MKKAISSILMLSLLVMSACQDNLSPELVKNTEKAQDQDHPVFHVTIADEGTRTQLNGSLQMEWLSGDQICIKNGDDSAIYQAMASGASVDFEYVSGATLPETGSFEAYYPASLATAAVLPEQQVYVAGNIGGLPMRATSTGLTLSFKHLCGILELNLSTEDSGIEVNGIKLESAEGMSGEFTLNGDSAQLGATTGDVNMNIETPVALSGATTKFYLAVPEGTYAAGTSFIVKTTQGWRVFKSNKALTFTRAHITPTTLTVDASKIYKARITTDAKATWSYFSALSDAIAAVPDNGTKSDCIVEMLSDFTMTARFLLDYKYFAFNGNGYTISVPSLATGASAIYLEQSSDVTFEQVTVEGPGVSVSSTFRPFALDKSSVLTLGKDVLVEGFKNSVNGGAVWGGSTTTLYVTDNAVIRDCHTSLAGGALFCEGNVYISDNAIISGCSASGNGGAISKGTAAGSVTISDNVRITSCRSYGSGGAIFSSALAATISLSGQSCIDHCSCAGNGGGLWFSGIFSMSGHAKIDSCSAKFGGGLQFWRTATLDEYALISRCEAQRGGAIYDTTGTTAGYGKLTLKGNAKLEECSAILGGGIYIVNKTPSTCTLSEQSSIRNCSSTEYGGGIYSYKPFTMSDYATISGCSASAAGGVYKNGSTFTMSDNALISDCSATDNGGGILLTGSSTMTMTGLSTVSNCSSGNYGGGIRVVSTSTLNMGSNEDDNPAIRECSATTGAAAISLYSGTFTMNHGEVSADSPVSMIYPQSGTATINGGIIRQSGAGNAINNAGSTLTFNGGQILHSGNNTNATNACAIYNTSGTTQVHGGYFLKTGSGSYIFYKPGGTFTTDCTVGACYLSHSTGNLSSGYICQEIDSSDPKYAEGYRYKVVAQ